ncbi:MAG: hypothetical protein A3B07_01755 [Candidatus Yonathbacteria bacterium RIFCSPLOWO2_01_FULL_43_27]|uniref:Uncharacterized protein n=1 Tax=Candidatus Yonathbacteria bacterium RIFCSPLOWO2_01_FULL_43_27 TaxID=1802726 RepID=A0A1G2SDA8_9BACT|nr:MAG: hypothetical protein A2658_01555 [Candidatus Yonathbacteria bacterium RIFCSPHIGHO2_01_FULL_44_19]OHA82639.1 MAG: hypothetical protein A3B07_01755 [Candidatus Yonathbacteria bacterium RIFCSPLOWO2_01_FULL_43_27]
MADSILDSKIQAKYGKREYNIIVYRIDFRDKDFLPRAYPGGIGTDPDIDVLERCGLAVSFAKKLQNYEKFTLSTSFNKERNVYCGHIIGLPTLLAEIVVDCSTVEFLAGGLNSFLSLSDGLPIAPAWVKDFRPPFISMPLGIFFRKKVIPVP